jgi:hypothetical protein
MTYTLRIPPESDRRRLNGLGLYGRRTLPLEWSATSAYIVGLMATDGCLISGRRQLNFKSEDEQLVRTFLNCLGRPPRYRPVPTRLGRLVYVTQFGDADLYRWLEHVGLSPRKSLSLGPLAVPDAFMSACARGLLDGDGSLLNFECAGTGKARGRRYEALVSRFFSASEAHIAWLRERLRNLLGIVGSINRPDPNAAGWQLNYAIRESCVLLPALYPTADIPKLERKWEVWRLYADRHGLRATGASNDFARSLAG